jgi:hypothetical protein
MSKSKKSRLEGAASEIDLRLGDLLGQLGEALVQAAGNLDAGGSSEILREREFGPPGSPIRASAGVRIRTLGGAAASSHVRRTDKPINTPQSATTSPEAAPPRRVDATIFAENDHWSIVADMPGITASDVTLTVTDQIRITAQNGTRNYLLETASSRYMPSKRSVVHDLSLRFTGGRRAI